ncbi:AAA family ATPase [Actinoplanes sp. NPDC049802]|uniref:bifunctional aminoglycoside phosphotransferase/ATP-binding protein n=1 Tax=Actinoplanes sp. NPDC049802 TaxID=3154742 RepID=UPI00341116CE
MTVLNQAEMLQTHSAVLVFFGDRAYKLKKPVDLGFVDYRRRADRFRACHREVRLNRRLAPDVYLGVADVLGPDGLPCDHMVLMRRMPAGRRLSTLVRQGAPVDGELRRLARVLAAFHGAARRGPAIDEEGDRAGLRGRWDTAFGQLRRFHGGVLDEDAAAEVQWRVHEFLDGRDRLFTDRIGRGRIVDGHGDLVADDIFVLDDGPRILDCLEFDDRLRYLDGLDDAASLAIDLEHLGARVPARRFLDWYAQFSGDPAPEPLRRHYLAYRAFDRARLACLRHEQGDPDAAADVASYIGLTLRHLRAGTARMILLGGPAGAGRTDLAGRLADRLGATVLSSDRIRRELAGLDPATSAAAGFGQGVYTREWTDRTYAELCWRARHLLQYGQSVILEASWARDRHRRGVRALASCTHSALTELRCAAPAPAVRRGAPAGGFPDADALIAGLLASEADDWPEAREIVSGPGTDDVADALSAVDGDRPAVAAGR